MASVPVDERTNARLRQLQEEIERRTGESVSKRDLLERIVEREFESRTALVESFSDGDDEFDGLSDAEIERALSETSDWGFETDETDIDAVLYGNQEKPDGDSE